MVDYQEYRHSVLHHRWRKRFFVASLVLLVVLLCCVAVLWRRLHRSKGVDAIQQNTLLQQTLTTDEWNTLSYSSDSTVTVQQLSTDSESTAIDFRMASLPQTDAVDKSWFNNVSFLGDSLTQGMQMYNTGLPDAQFCAYKGVGPNAVVNGTSCKRSDGVVEVPLEALAAQQPQAVYILLGTNVLGRNSDYTGFLSYYSRMLDMVKQALPDAQIYVQSITPVLSSVSQTSGHEGLNRDRLCRINNELAALALEKGCYFLNLWEVLADENGDLKAEYAQPDGYHLKPNGYTAWVSYLRTHTASSAA